MLPANASDWLEIVIGLSAPGSNTSTVCSRMNAGAASAAAAPVRLKMKSCGPPPTNSDVPSVASDVPKPPPSAPSSR